MRIKCKQCNSIIDAKDFKMSYCECGKVAASLTCINLENLSSIYCFVDDVGNEIIKEKVKEHLVIDRINQVMETYKALSKTERQALSITGLVSVLCIVTRPLLCD